MSTTQTTSPTATATYAAMVRKYHPQGWDHSYWAAVTKRDGAKRVTDISRHQHDAREAAQACADKLAALRNSGQSLR